MRNRGSASHSRPSSLSWHPVFLPPCRVIYLPWGRLDQSVLLTPWDRASASSAHPWDPGSGHQSHLAEPGESLAEQTVPTPGEVAVSSEFPGGSMQALHLGRFGIQNPVLVPSPSGYVPLGKSTSLSLTFPICKIGRIIAPRLPHTLVQFVH